MENKGEVMIFEDTQHVFDFIRILELILSTFFDENFNATLFIYLLHEFWLAINLTFLFKFDVMFFSWF